MEILLAIKVLVIIAIIAARHQNRIRDSRFGDTEANKPKKERMKKIRKFMNRTWRFLTPKKAQSRVHNDLKKLLNERELKYSIVMHNKDIELAFDCENGQRYKLVCSIESNSHLCFYVSFTHSLIPEAYDRLCHLAQMFNALNCEFKVIPEAVFVFAELVERNNAK